MQPVQGMFYSGPSTLHKRQVTMQIYCLFVNSVANANDSKLRRPEASNETVSALPDAEPGCETVLSD